MAEQYRVPKREIPAEITLIGQPRATMRLFVGDQAQTHLGLERPSDLLNGPNAFLPAVDAAGKTLLLARDALLLVSVEARHESGGDSGRTEDLFSTPRSSASIEAWMENGESLRGVVEYMMPEGSGRLVDFVNTADRFIALRQGEIIHLINKRRVTRIVSL